MAFDFYPARLKLFRRLLFWLLVASWGGIVLLPEKELLQTVIGIALLLSGLAFSYQNLRMLLASGPVVSVDQNHVFDRRIMMQPVPWTAITDVGASVQRTKQFFSGTLWGYTEFEVRVDVDDPAPFVERLPLIKSLLRSRFIGGNRSRFVIETRFLRGGAPPVIAAMAEAKPECASIPYIGFLHQLKAPEKTASLIERELGREVWAKAGMDTLYSLIYRARLGPLSPLSQALLKRRAADLIAQDITEPFEALTAIFDTHSLPLSPEAQTVVNRLVADIAGQKDVDLEDTLAALHVALEGPLSPEVEAVIDRLCKDFVARDASAVREAFDEWLKWSSVSFVTGRLSHALVDAGHPPLLTELQLSALEEHHSILESNVEEISPERSPVWPKIWAGIKLIMFGVVVLACPLSILGLADQVRLDCASKECWSPIWTIGLVMAAFWFSSCGVRSNWQVLRREANIGDLLKNVHGNAFRN